MSITLAAMQSEPPFPLTQAIVLGLFVAIAIGGGIGSLPED